MKKLFSNQWKASKQRRKQRKYRYNSPLHIKHKLVSSHLSKELMKKYSTRSISARKGDTVKILRGQFKNHVGKIEKVLLRKTRLYIEGAEHIKRDGTKSYYPIHPSNVIITTLNLDDKKRQKTLEKKNVKASS